jgi:hypothetical protein
MAIVNKNFRVKNGLIVDGSVATVNGYNILTEASTAFIINTVGGSADSANTPNTVVKRDGSGNFSAGTITATFSGNLTGDVTGTVSSIANHDTNSLAEGTGVGANLYFTNARALAATAAAYDAAGAASTAQANAASYTDSAITTEVTNRNNAISTAKGEAISAAASDATDKADAAYNNAVADAALDATSKANAAKTYAEGLVSTEATDRYNAITAAINTEIQDRNDAINSAISTEVTNRNDAIATAKGEAISSANSYTDGKVADLVDSAPELLNTLNEIAAAIADNPNYATDVANLVATKADTSYVNSEISDLDTAAQGYASAAQSAAEATAASDATTKANAAKSYADGLISTEVSDRNSAISSAITTEASDRNAAISTAISNEVSDRNDAIATAKGEAITDAAAHTDSVATDITEGATAFTEVNVNDVAKLKATETSVASAGTVNAMTWSVNVARTAKAIVKIKNGINTQVSEVLLTLDSNNNVAITEFGSIATDETLATISAAVNSNQVSISVTTIFASTDIMVYATLIK